MEMVRLLLRTKANDPVCPFRDNRHIGRGFIDHLHGIAGRVIDADRQRLRRLFEARFLSGIKVSSKIRPSDDFILRDGHANCAATIISRSSLSQYAAETGALLKRLAQNPLGNGAIEAVRRCGVLGGILLPMTWSYLVERRAYNLFSDEILLGVEVEQLPTIESYLFLDPDQAPEDAPIGVHWSVDGSEMRSLRAFCLEVAAFMGRSNLGFVDLDRRILDGDPSFFDDCHDAYHHMGGVRMACDPAHGVVSPDLQVFGVRNLWAVGPAVFPSGSFANPTLVGMALALRLADALLRETMRAEAVVR